MKLPLLNVILLMLMSHPSRGAWIEMMLPTVSCTAAAGRTPRGVRGLKSAWLHGRHPRSRSHPSRGAWIEMVYAVSVDGNSYGRTPRGVRGLKFNVAAPSPRRHGVAPLAGCVD